MNTHSSLELGIEWRDFFTEMNELFHQRDLNLDFLGAVRGI